MVKIKVVNFGLALVVSLFFQVALMEVTVKFFPRFKENSVTGYSSDIVDPSLSRLNSVDKFIGFCDSVFGKEMKSHSDSAQYANLVSKVIRYRFEHGYSWYRFGHNYIAKLVAPMLNKNLSAIVVPDDILEYQSAACSQQSIVGMKVLMEKGFIVRPIGFYDTLIGGHFCYEIKFNGVWHFYDPNREPDEELLDKYNRPSIKELNENKELLVAAYPRDKKENVLALYSTYKYGKESKLPGANARLFQQITQILSYTLWIFLALLYLYLDKRFFSKKTK
jgi:hypothetical protein